MTTSIRLAKHIAELVPCSRREADQYIEGGWVKVDGQIVEEPGYRLMTHQSVDLNPAATLAAVEPVTILLHKPAGIATDTAVQLIVPDTLVSDAHLSMRFLKRHAVGLTLTEPLEKDASGLLVFTQDWRIARKLIEDAARLEQEYIIEVTGEIVRDGLQLLNHGLTFNGKALPPIKVSWQNETRLRFAIKAPQRGLIMHMCEKVGLKVLTTRRIRIGRMSMAGLPSGGWRYLAGYERF